MEQAQPIASLSLEEVYNHFQQWRNTRESESDMIPEALLAEARSLLGRYTQINVLRKLGLNRQRLLPATSASRESDATESDECIAPSPFVQLPWPTPATTSQSLELTHPNGMTLRLQDCNEAMLSQMINSFMDRSPCCK